MSSKLVDIYLVLTPKLFILSQHVVVNIMIVFLFFFRPRVSDIVSCSTKPLFSIFFCYANGGRSSAHIFMTPACQEISQAVDK